MKDLKDCPFCGHNKTYLREIEAPYGPNDLVIGCENCRAEASQVTISYPRSSKRPADYDYDKERLKAEKEAKKWWNEQVYDSCLDNAIEKIRRLVAKNLELEDNLERVMGYIELIIQAAKDESLPDGAMRIVALSMSHPQPPLSKECRDWAMKRVKECGLKDEESDC